MNGAMLEEVFAIIIKVKGIGTPSHIIDKVNKEKYFCHIS